MTVGERKPRGYQAGLVVCIVILVVLGLWGFTLLNQVNSLNADKTNLQSQVNSLTSDKTNLQNQVNSLQSQINTYSAWLSGNVTLLQNYKATHSYSNSEYDELYAIVKLQKSQVLDNNKTVVLPRLGEETLLYSTPYAGYIKVNFTASEPVYFWVGSSFTGKYYARYPSQAEAASGSFIIPVFAGTTLLYMVNPSYWAGTTVTFTVIYVY